MMEEKMDKLRTECLPIKLVGESLAFNNAQLQVLVDRCPQGIEMSYCENNKRVMFGDPALEN
jgi:hypothetical protein|tara:strand:+ start:1340 stop:1525 length:186 start_codon:yes stop_codon:yes gene_type:complete